MILEAIHIQYMNALDKNAAPTVVRMNEKTKGHLTEELRKRKSWRSAEKKPPAGVSPSQLTFQDLYFHDPHRCADCITGSKKSFMEHGNTHRILVVLDKTLPDDYVLLGYDEIMEIPDTRTGKVTRVVKPQ